MIEPWKVRAAREALRWSQGMLAKKAGLTQPYISDYEKEKLDNPSAKTLENIESAFLAEGVYFTDNGIERRLTHVFSIEGPDCYVRLLEDAHRRLKNGGLIRFSASSDRRSPSPVIQKLQAMRHDRIEMRCLIEKGETYLMGPPAEYRWMPDDLFVDGDVKVIYADRVAYLASWAEPMRVLVLQGEKLADEARRTFDYIWRHADGPRESTADIRFAD